MTADINPPPLVFTAPPEPPSPGRFSKLAIAGFVLALLAIPAGVVLAIALFHQLLNGPQDEAGAILLGLFGASWLGFLGAIFGAVSLRKMRGPVPEYRGRVFALISTAGARAALLAIALAFAAIPIGSWLGGGGVEFKIVQSCWWVGGMLVAWYVGAMIRRAKRPAMNRGLGALFSGIAFHLLLIFTVPTMMAAAFFSMQPPQFNGRQSHRNGGSTMTGLYATRDVRLSLPQSPETPVTVRLWENGQGKDIASLTLSGSIGYRWMLSQSFSGAHTLAWAPVRNGGASESRQLELPSDLDLLPAGDRLNLAVESGKSANVWLFVPFDQAVRNSPAGKAPDWGVELIVGKASASVR